MLHAVLQLRMPWHSPKFLKERILISFAEISYTTEQRAMQQKIIKH